MSDVWCLNEQTDVAQFLYGLVCMIFFKSEIAAVNFIISQSFSKSDKHKVSTVVFLLKAAFIVLKVKALFAYKSAPLLFVTSVNLERYMIWRQIK